MIQARKSLAVALVMVLLAVATACGGKTATSAPSVSPAAAVPVPTSASVPTAPPAPAETTGSVARTSQPPRPSPTPAGPSLEEVLGEVDRLLEGWSFESPDFVASPLGILELPELDTDIPAGVVSGLGADFDWQFEVPDLDIEPPAVSSGDLAPRVGGFPGFGN